MARLRIKKSDAVVLINGYSSQNNDFETLMPTLRFNRNVLIISLPGDLGEAEDDFLKFDEWIKIHSDAIESLKKKTKRLLVVGFSIGSVPALYFASKFNADKVALISPVLNYETFDNSTTALVRMARSTIISKGKNDPINSIKSLRFIGTFIKNPKKNWAQLFRVRLGPLMNPSNVLLLPIVTLFEEELDKVDSVGSKIVNHFTKRKYNRDFDFETEEDIFNKSESKKEVKATTETEKKNLFTSVFKQVRKNLPPEFANISSANVYNMMKLLAYCDKFTKEVKGRITVYRGLDDITVSDSSIKAVLSKGTHFSNRVISYNTDMHYLFASEHYGFVASDLLGFLFEKDTKDVLNTNKDFNKKEEQDNLS